MFVITNYINVDKPKSLNNKIRLGHSIYRAGVQVLALSNPSSVIPWKYTQAEHIYI